MVKSEEEYEKIAEEVKKIRYNLENGEFEIGVRLELLNVLRYDLSLLEERDKVRQVWYDVEEKRLRYSESVEIGIAISYKINEVIIGEEDLERQKKLYMVMQETYYYLARHLFEYFLPAMEFGIAPEKQFIAPRTVVLNEIARKLSEFYYREDRPIMTLSMPQRNGKRTALKQQNINSKWLDNNGRGKNRNKSNRGRWQSL